MTRHKRWNKGMQTQDVLDVDTWEIPRREQLDWILQQLDAVWLADSQTSLPAVLLGKAKPETPDFPHIEAGMWVIVVVDRIEEQEIAGPFPTLDEALEYAVRHFAAERLTRLVSMDTYLQREGYDDSQAADDVLEHLVSAAYDVRVAPEHGWLLRKEEDRVAAIRLFHRRQVPEHPAEGDSWGHAILHILAEAALLSAELPAFAEAYAAWRAAGLSRHEAIHALGDAIEEHLQGSRRREPKDLEACLAGVVVEHYRGTIESPDD